MSLLRDHKTAYFAHCSFSICFHCCFDNQRARGTRKRSISAQHWKYIRQISDRDHYSWLFLMNAYILTWLCRGLYSSPAILPSEFFLSWIINMILNGTWLVLWDRELMIPALIVLALIAFTSYLMIFFSCLGLQAHGSWHVICVPQVQNGIATYATWTTIATLLNFTIVLDLASVSPTNAATSALCILLLEVIFWKFTVENVLIEKHVRYILTVYPVIIYALIGSLSKHYIAAGPGRNAIFSVVLLVLACILLAVRVGLVVWRHRTRPLFREVSPEVLMSPAQINNDTS